jgi:hypothetical protein
MLSVTYYWLALLSSAIFPHVVDLILGSFLVAAGSRLSQRTVVKGDG